MSFILGSNGTRRARWYAAAVLLLAVAAGGCKGNTVATVNGKGITATDLDKRVAFLEVAYRHPLRGGAYDEAKGQVLDMLIEEEIVVQEAKRRRLAPDAKQIAEEEKWLTGYLNDQVFGGSRQQFEDGLKKAGLTREYLRYFVERQLMGNMVFGQVTGEVAVTPQEAEDYFNSNRDLFRDPEQVKLLEITVETPADGGKALAELQAGTDFKTVAGKYSLDPQVKEDGGDRGYVTREGLPKEVADAAFQLKPGETSGLVESQSPPSLIKSYHILRVEDKKPVKEYTFAEVKDDLQNRLLQEKQRQTFAKFLQELSSKARVSRK